MLTQAMPEIVPRYRVTRAQWVPLLKGYSQSYKVSLKSCQPCTEELRGLLFHRLIRTVKPLTAGCHRIAEMGRGGLASAVILNLPPLELCLLTLLTTLTNVQIGPPQVRRIHLYHTMFRKVEKK